MSASGKGNTMKDEQNDKPKPSEQSRRSFFHAVAATAAAAGAGCQTRSETTGHHDASVASPPEADLHICKGLNMLPQDGKGPGECDCANVSPHGCAGGNSCKGLGGCGTGDYATQYWVAENLCGKVGEHWNGTGGCGSPIGNTNTGFVQTQMNNAVPTPEENPKNLTPPFVGVPVWAIARARFEQKMVKQDRAFKAPDLTIGKYRGNIWHRGTLYQNTGNLPDPYPDPMPPKKKPVAV